jgi:ribosomal protein L40E
LDLLHHFQKKSNVKNNSANNFNDYEPVKELGKSLKSHSICPKCGKNNSESAKFCIVCGSNLVDYGIYCTECGGKNPSNAKFCQECGKEI